MSKVCAAKMADIFDFGRCDNLKYSGLLALPSLPFPTSPLQRNFIVGEMKFYPWYSFGLENIVRFLSPQYFT